jgi:hypothetical protein
MRLIFIAPFAAAFLFLCGCGPARPLTESEFKGFCYQYEGLRQADCDTISVCSEYLSVTGQTQESRAKCLEGCQRVYQPQYMRYITDGCAGPAQAARAWCERFCMTNYPQ